MALGDTPGPEPICAALNKSGGFLYRPWYDHLVLPLVARLLFPLSRAWAAASALSTDCGDPVDVFLGSFPGRGRLMLKRPIETTMDAAAAYRKADAEWQAAAFGDGDRDRIASLPVQNLYQDLRRAMTSWMACRWRFLPAQLARGFPAVHVAIEAPDLALEAQSDYLSALEPPFPINPEVTGWHEVPGLCRHRWLRVPSPTPFSLDDMFWAQQMMPFGGAVKGMVMLAHGTAMEEEFWLGISATSARLLKEGYGVILPEGPGHSRRMLAGFYGGENAMAAGPLSFAHYLNAHARELASLIAWTRLQVDEKCPVLLSGISLGALTVQTLLSKAAQWGNAEMIPDAALLITACDDFAAILKEGRLATDTGLRDAVWAAGWQNCHVAEAALALNPSTHPALPSEKIGILLGTHDVVLPIRTGYALVERWKIPEQNIFLRRQGHFSASLGLSQATEPVRAMMAAATR